MGRFLRFSLYLCLSLAAVTAHATGNSSVPVGMRDMSASSANLNVTRTSPELTTIALQTPAVVTQDTVLDYQSYKMFGIAGEPVTLREGDPMLPQVTRFYRIPNTGGADLVITNAEYDVIDNVNAFPVQPDNASFGSVSRNEAVYSKDEWYPANVAQMSDPMIWRDFRIVTVTLYPVQVNPVTHQARVYRNLSVDVVANNHPSVNELTNPRRPSGDWAPMYRALIANLDDNALDDVTNTPGSYLIIATTSSSISQFVDSLFQWKTRKGYKVVVDARSNWTSATMIQQIRSDYALWDPPLEYVTLMGDPSWTGVGVPTDGTNPLSGGNLDHTFGLGNLGDDIEDIGVGRLSGASTTDMNIINAKLMAYERTPATTDTNWFHKAFLYAGTANSCASNYTLMQWGAQQFQEHTSVNNISVQTHGSGGVDQNVINTQLNSGVGYFIWRGSWISQMPSGTAQATTPGYKLPVCMTITCATGDFASGTCISEEWLRAGNSATDLRGGICGIGNATPDTHNPENICLASGFMYDIADLGVEHLGTALAGAKAQLYYTYGSQQDYERPGTTLAGNFSRYCNLMGEPGLSMWTDAPEPLTVSHPTSVNVGTSSVDVTVRRSADNAYVQDALVVLWKRSPDSTWVRGMTDASGHVTLPVNVRASGDMYLTVTKHNVKPYLYTINCVQAGAMPMVSTYTVDDDNIGGTQGNGDHSMNPGETIDLPVYIRNFGNSTTVTGISATLTSTSTDVTVTQGSATYTNLVPGDSALGSTPFRIHVDPDLQNNVQVLLTVTINSSAGQTVGTIPLTCRAGMAVYQRQYLSPAFVPGGSTTLTVAVKNTGAITMTGVTGHLVSLSPFVQVGDADAVFGDIAAGALDSNNTDPLTLSAPSLTYPGHQAPMLLILTSTTGFVDTATFNVTVGTAQTTDPTGPDAYGYYAYDNTDVNTTPHPTYNYVNISSTGINLNLADTGEKTLTSQVWSVARVLPFRFKFYGHVYDSITVCSNGWLAFGNQAWDDNFRNYPIPAMAAPDAMIAPYWDDLATSGTGLGVWYYNDTANHRVIVQWKAAAWGGSTYSVSQDFEVMLYDTTYTPTPDGNGRVVMQYNTVTMNLANQYSDESNGCTIGIQSPGNLVGLGYVYGATYTPGSATVVSGRAIMFSTENAVPLLTPVISISAPNGGETWYTGLSSTINWSSVSIPGNVNIALNRNYPAGAWESLFSNVANTGSQAWTPTLPLTSNARIRVISVNLPAVGDTSAAAFTIAQPSLTITNPHGGEILPQGQVTSVVWNFNPPALGPARVELNRNYPVGTWEQLSAASTGSFDWAVSGASTNQARFRVIANSVATVGDTMDANFTIGTPPTITHVPHADANLGPVVFVANVTDDAPGFTAKVFYRQIGAMNFDSLTLVADGYANEFAVTTAPLAAGSYEYYLRAVDPQLLTTFYPVAGTCKFDVGAIGNGWTAYDDGTAENYNWNDGPGFLWAVKFDPGSYPYALSAGRFAVCPTHPYAAHAPILFQVILANGPNGTPGTVVFADTTGSAGNAVGGLPAGPAWADVVTRVNGQSLQLNGPFYLAVGNTEPRVNPVAFATDTNSTRSHQSFIYDACNTSWYNEDAAQASNRPGNRLIRADGFPLGPLQVVIYRTDSASTISSTLRWTANGAPYYHIYMATDVNGPFTNLIGTIPGPATGQIASFTDVNAVNLGIKRFYRVYSSDQP